jgi:hypothetical protein
MMASRRIFSIRQTLDAAREHGLKGAYVWIQAICNAIKQKAAGL